MGDAVLRMASATDTGANPLGDGDASIKIIGRRHRPIRRRVAAFLRGDP
jgi:hypothetical protein